MCIYVKICLISLLNNSYISRCTLSLGGGRGRTTKRKGDKGKGGKKKKGGQENKRKRGQMVNGKKGDDKKKENKRG